MIKEEGVQGKENEFWSFKDKGKRFIVSKRKNLFTFKVHDELLGEWHQSQQVELYNINEKTIEAAFDSKISSVQCTFFCHNQDQFLQTSKKDAILRFIIKVQYIATQFKEDINMKRLQINKQNATKLQYGELEEQILRVDNMIECQRQFNTEAQTIIEKGHMDSKDGPIYQIQVKKGKHLLTITGQYLSSVAYYGESDEQSGGYDRLALFGNDQHSSPLKAQIHIGEDEVLQLISTRPSFLYGHNFHFVISTFLDLKKQEKITIDVHLANGSRVIISTSMLTIFPISQLNN